MDLFVRAAAIHSYHSIATVALAVLSLNKTEKTPYTDCRISAAVFCLALCIPIPAALPVCQEQAGQKKTNRTRIQKIRSGKL